jgi:hypothetical protein
LTNGPTAAAVAPFVNRILAGERREEIIADIIASNEYYAVVGNTLDSFIYAVYADLFTPDGEANLYWPRFVRLALAPVWAGIDRPLY